jgi:hypothetical protein
VPPEAASSRPSRLVTAPEKAPFSLPNSSLSMMLSAKAAQFTATNGPSRRGDQLCRAWAAFSLPTAGLALDEHRQIGGGEPPDQADQPHHRRIGPPRWSESPISTRASASGSATAPVLAPRAAARAAASRASASQADAGYTAKPARARAPTTFTRSSQRAVSSAPCACATSGSHHQQLAGREPAAGVHRAQLGLHPPPDRRLVRARIQQQRHHAHRALEQARALHLFLQAPSQPAHVGEALALHQRRGQVEDHGRRADGDGVAGEQRPLAPPGARR